MLAPDDVEIWTVSLEASAPELERSRRTLSPDEVSRAERFYFERHRRRFLVARGMLRRLLGEYLGVEPRGVELSYGPHGKPAVEGIRFNLAHSHELAVYAFSRERELGVDVEWVRPLRDAQAIAERFFSERENEALRDLPEEERLRAFFRCWTQKEAYLKALGDGLARPLSGFDVEVAPGGPARLLRVEADAAEPERWSLQSLPVPEAYAAALAVEGTGARVIARRWVGS